MRQLLLLVLAAAWAGSGVAQTIVQSPRADSTSITIYRNGIAQITETRRVDLPAGPVTLMLQGVVETLLPQSAIITGLDRARVENNYDFDALTPQTLIERSVGKQVVVVRTDRARGVQTRSLATVVSASNGVVLQFDDGTEALRCSGLPERLEFSELPGELSGRPTLSVKMAEGTAGPRTVTVSYLAQRFSWNANYVATLNDAANKLDLLGWVTLSNGTDTNFRGVQVQVIAGRMQVLPEWQGGSGSKFPQIPDWDDDERDSELPLMMRLPACHPPALVPVVSRVTGVASQSYESASPMVSLDEVQVTGSRIISREELGDYKLYRIDWLTDLNAHQAKQAAFMRARSVAVERFYQVKYPLVSAVHYPQYPNDPVKVHLRWKNRKSAGLGEPMPAGNVAVFEQSDHGGIFAGEARIDDQPVGSLVEFSFAEALNIYVEHILEPLPGGDIREENKPYRQLQRIAQRVSHHLLNFKDAAVKVELQPLVDDYDWSTPKLRKSSSRSKWKDGNPLWVVTIPAGGERSVSYEIRTESLHAED